jgi:photosystem II stability/assembly factor-like uncharacterized protein
MRWKAWKWLPILVVGLLVPMSHAGAIRSPVQRTTGDVTGSALAAPLVSVICLSSQKCVAIGSGSRETKCFGGGCSGSVAYAIGARTSDGGTHWASTPLLKGVGTLRALSCATAETCIGVGYNLVGNDNKGAVLRTGAGGRSWVLVSGLPRGVGVLSSISCPTSLFCMAVGASQDGDAGVALVTTSSGQRWSVGSLPKGEKSLALVTCTSPRNCIAEGGGQSGFAGTIITTANGGRTWQQSSPPTGTGPVGIPYSAALTCPLPTRCFIVGYSTPGDGTPSGYIMASADGGKDWAFDGLPPGTTSPNAIACASSSDCVVVGGGIGARGGLERLILTTTDGGGTWISRSVPTGVTGLNAVACPTVTTCVATGINVISTSPYIRSAVAVTSDGGADWTALP